MSEVFQCHVCQGVFHDHATASNHGCPNPLEKFAAWNRRSEAHPSNAQGEAPAPVAQGEQDDNPKDFKCPVCLRHFFSQGELGGHLIGGHTDEEGEAHRIRMEKHTAEAPAPSVREAVENGAENIKFLASYLKDFKQLGRVKAELEQTADLISKAIALPAPTDAVRAEYFLRAYAVDCVLEAWDAYSITETRKRAEEIVNSVPTKTALAALSPEGVDRG